MMPPHISGGNQRPLYPQISTLLAAVTWLYEHDAAVVDVPAEPASAAPVVKRSAGN
jgi:hypothetical protein